MGEGEVKIECREEGKKKRVGSGRRKVFIPGAVFFYDTIRLHTINRLALLTGHGAEWCHGHACQSNGRNSTFRPRTDIISSHTLTSSSLA